MPAAHQSSSARADSVPSIPRSSDRLRLALIGSGPPWPPAAAALIGGTAWCTAEVRGFDEPREPAQAAEFDLIVACNGSGNGVAPGDSAALRIAFGRGIPIIWLADARDFRSTAADEITLPLDSTCDQLRGAVVALTQLRPAMQRIESELASLYALGNQLHTHFDELQRDLTLAARLQRDFLPRELPDASGLRFATLYRPCSWISGDSFDIFRIDDRRIGFYVMDAMGHGVAAALLTMFLRNAIRSRRPDSTSDTPSPAEVLTHLNDVLVDERLPDCQFVTGWYGVLDTQTRELTYCNGGHPPALRVRSDLRTERLSGEGCLLGVFDGRTFKEQTVRLDPGDRILLFSDGLEDLLVRESADGQQVSVAEDFHASVRLPAPAFITAMSSYLDECPGAFSARNDDVSLVVIEVLQ